ncbi:MAG: hypothetical protein M3Z24_02240, partial [Chloroflexota bacterium]|nr:hypothetical protein [Chloroflexota bacterium]
MEVELQYDSLDLNASTIVTTILSECSAITDYRTLRDSLPRRLASLLKCRCVLLYQRIGETLQFASGSFDDTPGWSAALLSVAHIHPIDLAGNTPEARAWRSRHVITTPVDNAHPTLIAVPLLYRRHTIGVLVATRNAGADATRFPLYWRQQDSVVVEAVGRVVALLLENTRLLERDRERISELSLLNSIASQLNCSMYEFERIQQIVI